MSAEPGTALERAADRIPEGRQLLHTGTGMASFQALSLIAGLLVAAGLGPEGQGRFQLLVSTCVFLAMFCKLGLDEGVAYLIPRLQQDDPAKVRAVAIYVLGLTATLGVLVGLGLRAASAPLARSVFELPSFATDLALAPLLLPTLILLMVASNLLRGLGRSDLRALAYYWPAGLGFLLFVVALSFDGLELGEAYAARIGSYGIGAAVGLFLVARIVRGGAWRLDAQEIRRLHSFSSWLVFVSLFLYLVGQPLVDLLIVSRYGSAADVGVYSVAARIASLPGSIHAAFAIVMASSFSRARLQPANASAAHYEKASTWMAHMTVLSGAALFFLGDHVLAAIGSEYEAAGPMLRTILVGYLLMGTLGLNAPALLAAGHTRVEFALSGIALAVLVVAGLSLAPWLGPPGVAVATGGAVGVLALLRWLACYRLVMHTPPRWLCEVVGAGALAIGASLLVRGGVAADGLSGSLLELASFSASYGALISLRHRTPS